MQKNRFETLVNEPLECVKKNLKKSYVQNSVLFLHVWKSSTVPELQCANAASFDIGFGFLILFKPLLNPAA